jgi:hypothetical protein
MARYTCPHCGNGNTGVLRTISTKHQTKVGSRRSLLILLRRRECKQCGQRITTREIPEDDLFQMQEALAKIPKTVYMFGQQFLRMLIEVNKAKKAVEVLGKRIAPSTIRVRGFLKPVIDLEGIINPIPVKKRKAKPHAKAKARKKAKVAEVPKDTQRTPVTIISKPQKKKPSRARGRSKVQAKHQRRRR